MPWKYQLIIRTSGGFSVDMDYLNTPRTVVQDVTYIQC
jgi:hypothetical protein